MIIDMIVDMIMWIAYGISPATDSVTINNGSNMHDGKRTYFSRWPSNEESKPDDLPPQSFEHYHECLHWFNVLGAKHVINRCGCFFRKLLGFKPPLCEVLSGQDRSPGSLHQEKQTLRFESLLMFPTAPSTYWSHPYRIGVPAPKSWVVQSLQDLEMLMCGP